MIVTVTLNPAWDVTYRLPALRPGHVHRMSQVHRRPGGKGVNVASVLHSLGNSLGGGLGNRVVATGFADATFGEAVAGLGLDARFVVALPMIRSTVAVVADDTTTTSLWEPGVALIDPETARRELTALLTSLLGDGSVLVVSGSLPPGLTPEVPASLAALATGLGARTILDTSGPALVAAARTPGVVLMPNADELAELARRPVDSVRQVASASRLLVDSGVGAVIATRGHGGLIVTDDRGSWHIPAPRAVSGNPTGAGDAAAAAIAHALAGGEDLVSAGCDAVALAATAVAAPIAGEVDLDLYAELRPLVSPVRLEGQP